MMIHIFDRVETLWEKEQILVTSTISFYHNVSIPLMAAKLISSTFNMLSANAFSLDLPKILLFGIKELMHLCKASNQASHHTIINLKQEGQDGPGSLT